MTDSEFSEAIRAVSDKTVGTGGTDDSAFADNEFISINQDFERFDQANDLFCRGFWDTKISNRMTNKFFRSFVKPLERARDSAGFQQKDYALRNGPWTVTETLAELQKGKDRRDGFWDDFSSHLPPSIDEPVTADPTLAAKQVKKVARLYGADLVGITAYDERWTYASKFSARNGEAKAKAVNLPDSLTSCIVVAKEMDYETLRTSPAATASAAPAAGYAHDAVLLLALAQYIRSLGYVAVACQNDTTLAIPYAVQAGLGEYGRNGLCITPQFGPRIRLGRVLTDMPLAHDKPRSFGVAKTCEICRRCANNCPPQAISHGAPSNYRYNRSNIKGVKKWTTDGEKCFRFWVGQGTDCANCVRTCPYNKDYSKRLYRLLMRLMASPLRRLALWLDDRLRLHDQLPTHQWWGEKSATKDPTPRAASHSIDTEKIRTQVRAIQLKAERHNSPRN
ncbi:MAG: reductive dehalogenase [Pseudomonadota bacterium]